MISWLCSVALVGIALEPAVTADTNVTDTAATAPETTTNAPAYTNIAPPNDFGDSVDRVTMCWFGFDGKMKWGKIGSIDANGVESPWFDGAVPPETPGAGGSRFQFVTEGLSGGTFRAWATNGKLGSMPIKPGDKLFVYVFLDPADTPFEFMVELRAHNSNSNRAFWGTMNKVTHQDPVRAGPLPETGKWVRVVVDTSLLGRTGIFYPR